MAKIRIDGVSYGNSEYIVMITLVEPQMVEGVEIQVSLGEAPVRFPSDAEMDDVKKKIVKAAEAIWKAHRNAQDKRHDISELEFPPIP